MTAREATPERLPKRRGATFGGAFFFGQFGFEAHRDVWPALEVGRPISDI
jgi:hypothetical protein